MTPANIVDIMLIAVLALSLIIGLARGLMQSLLGVVIFVVAILGSGWVANTFAQPVTDWILPYVEEFVVDEVTTAVATPQTASLGGDLLEGLGDMMEEMVNGIIATGVTALEDTLGGILHTVAFVILFLLSMLVLTLLLRLITTPLRLVERVPVLGLANRLGGGILGLVLGILICFLITAAVKLTGFIDPHDTYLYSFFAANTPASLLALLR